MDKEEFEIILRKASQEINIELEKEQIEKFYQYMEILLHWNKKINLTAITEPKDIILKHLIDSLTIQKYIKESSYLVDIGTGAGFPGIPLKIYRKDIKIVLLDSLNKRINFLNEVCRELKLENINTIHSRAEECARNKKYREKFDIVTSRAVANLSTLTEYMLPLTKIGGLCICMKGKDIEEELKEAKKAICVLGGTVKEKEEFFLNSEEKISRNIIILKKIKATPSKYPRKAGIPSKEPLK